MNVNPFSYLIEKLKSKVSKSGDTMSGNLTVDRRDGTISAEGYSYVIIGNDKATGTDKNSTGMLDLFGDTGNRVRLYALSPTATRYIGLPDKNGTAALTSDIQLQNMITAKSVNSGSTETANLLSDFSLADYNMINIVVYDNNWVRGSVFVTRNPINNLFNTIVPCMSGGSAKDMTVKQNSNTQLEFTNNVGLNLTVIVRGAKGF